MRRFSQEKVVEVAKRLDSFHWSWEIGEVGSALQAAGLVPLSALDEPSVRTEHPDLPGVNGLVVNMPEQGLVLRVSVTLTEIDSSGSAESQAAFDAAYKEYEAALIDAFGSPEELQAGPIAVWDRGEEWIKLRRLRIAVDLARESKISLQIREGE